MKKSIFLLLFTTLFLFSCNSQKLQKKELTITRCNNSTINVTVEVADTEETRTKGYMGRKTILDGTGMIFVFKVDQILSFWMKNTPHPLSIAYIDSKGKIRDIYDMTPFSTDSIVSTVSVRYALEVPQGWFKKNNINVGDYVDVSSFQ